MTLYGKARQRARYRHWETWASLVLLVLCTAAGNYLGDRMGYPRLLTVIGAIAGAVIVGHTERYVDARYNQ